MKQEFQEYETVYAKCKLSEKVPKGTMGAIVMIYGDDSKMLEIEFVDTENEHLELLTVCGNKISKLPIEHI